MLLLALPLTPLAFLLAFLLALPLTPWSQEDQGEVKELGLKGPYKALKGIPWTHWPSCLLIHGLPASPPWEVLARK